MKTVRFLTLTVALLALFVGITVSNRSQSASSSSLTTAGVATNVVESATPARNEAGTATVDGTKANPNSPQPLPSTHAAATPPPSVQPTATAPAGKPREMFRVLGVTTGKPLVAGSADFVREQLAGRRPVGRVTPVDAASWVGLHTLRVGDAVRLPLAEGEAVEGKIQAVKPNADGTAGVAGQLTQGETGSFVLEYENGKPGGVIRVNSRRLAYQIETIPSGAQVIREVSLGDVICEGLQPAPGEAAPLAGGPAALTPVIPVLNSRPTATAQLYLDFDGEAVNQLYSGGAINAPAFDGITDELVTELFERVKEDFLPFDINVTTERAKFDNAPAGQRMQCIITPEKAAARYAFPQRPDQSAASWEAEIASTAGVAATNSFKSTTDRAAWVYDIAANFGALAISHELGHTLGLSHDNNGSAFRVLRGHGGTGPTSWCPIMGSSGSKQVTQWSKGQYLGSTQGQDDLAIISSVGDLKNNFGYAADEAGDTPATAVLIPGTASSFSRSGIVTKATDSDYSFFTSGGAVTLTATPASPSPNLDIVLELQNSGGAVLASNNPADGLGATLSASLVPGLYYVKIAGTGVGNPMGNPATGYTSYGSIGGYTLTGTGTFGNSPSITSFTPASGPAGTSVTINGALLSSVLAVRFNGWDASFTINSATQITATVPLFASTGPVTVVAPDGTATSASNFTVTYLAPTITGFTPTSGSIGSFFQIFGTNLLTATAVTINGVNAEFLVNFNDTEIQAYVPAGATTGPISVTTQGGAVTTAANFTVNSGGSSGAWSTTAWTGDATTGIPATDSDANGHLVVALHFGSSTNATISGRSDGRYVEGILSGTGTSYITPSPLNWLTYTGATNNLTAQGGTGSAVMAAAFGYGNDPQNIILQNLTPGQSYRVSFFSVGWEAPGGRLVDFGSGTDHLVVDQDQFGYQNGIRVDYRFTASTASQTIILDALNSGNTWHNHAIALVRIVPQGPTVTNLAATSVTTTSAVLNGRVNANGSATNSTFYYGINTPSGNSSSALPSPVTGWSDTTVSRTVTGLLPHTQYQVTLFGSNAAGASYGGGPSVFMTANTVPVANSSSVSTQEDTAGVYHLLAASDADGDVLTATVVVPPAHGTVSFSPPYTQPFVTYTPAANYSGSDVFSYRVSDGFGGTSATANVNITVVAVNDTPTLDGIADRAINEDAGTQTVNLAGISAGGGESQTLTVTAISSDPTLIPNPTVTYTSPNATGSLSFAPVGNANGTAYITVAVSDGSEVAATTFGVTVNPVNDVPSFTLPAGGAAGVTWTAQASGSRAWRSIASSADGTKLAAVVHNGQIYTSTNSGATWTARESNRQWRSIASSANGTWLAAAVFGGQIYTSTDSGVTWTARASSRLWWSIASSADGTKLVAGESGTGGYIYTSTDAGVTWTARMNDINRQWQGMASSADGTKLAAAVYGGQIYTSTNSGLMWTARNSNRDWYSITSSGDGTKLAAVNAAQIFTSIDSGVTWTTRESVRSWYSITSSEDGTRLAAGVFDGQIYTSIDSGVNWTARDSNRYWEAIASSADGSKLAAAVSGGGQIYTSVAPPYGLSAASGAGAVTVAAFATNISPGPANEAAQTVSFNVSNTNNALFTAQPAIASNGTLTFTPNPSATGTATITVTAQDNGGVGFGGVDTSAPQTFTITVTTSAPTVTTPTVTNLTATGATLGGDVAGTGGSAITARGVVYSLTSVNANPTLATGTVVTASGTTGVFTVPTGVLSVNSGYTFKAYATNALGTSYTSAATFTTLGLPDILVTQAGAVADGGSVGFGTRTVGSPGAPLTFIITNPGTAALTGLAVSGGTGEFAVSALSATTVAPGGAGATFTVTFTPSASGARTASLQIASNVAGAKNPYDIALAGTGESVAASWAAANGVSSDLNIPGANGLSNLLNLAFGIHPVTGGPGTLQYTGTLAGGGTISGSGQPLTVMEGADIRALFIRRKDYAAAGLTYTPRFSADLTTWADSAMVPTVLADDGTHQIVSVPYPPLAGGFFQLRVSVAP